MLPYFFLDRVFRDTYVCQVTGLVQLTLKHSVTIFNKPSPGHHVKLLETPRKCYLQLSSASCYSIVFASGTAIITTFYLQDFSSLHYDKSPTVTKNALYNKTISLAIAEKIMTDSFWDCFLSSHNKLENYCSFSFLNFFVASGNTFVHNHLLLIGYQCLIFLNIHTVSLLSQCLSVQYYAVVTYSVSPATITQK